MASKSLDLGNVELDSPWAAGIHMLPQSGSITELGQGARRLYQDIDQDPEACTSIDILCEMMNQHVEGSVSNVLSSGKIPGVVGGDHSVAFGAFRAIDSLGEPFSILHFDAHLDMRDAYEGLKYSHASVFHNALTELKSLERVVSVGVRDFGPAEVNFCNSQGDRTRVFYDVDMASRKLDGVDFSSISSEIISSLTDNVWISLDIDGLDPSLCPNTGTPVPGGLNYGEISRVISDLGKSGKRIIGFDLNEVSPDPTGMSDWDANVGMRVLYSLCSWTLHSRGMTELLPKRLK